MPHDLFKTGTSAFPKLAPLGHVVAIRIGFITPLFEENTLPDQWVTEYTSRGLMLFDPVMQWVYGHTGAVRWSEIPHHDPRGVLASAYQYGLRYGAVACCMDPDTKERSFTSISRSDREFDEKEIALLLSKTQRLHTDLKRPENLTDAEVEALRMLRSGQRFKQIAFALGISESAVKARLTNAKKKLGARTSAQALTRAASWGLI